MDSSGWSPAAIVILAGLVIYVIGWALAVTTQERAGDLPDESVDGGSSLKVPDAWPLERVLDSVTAWNHRDWLTVESLHAHDVVYETPLARVVGRGAVVRRFQELVAQIPDLQTSELRMTENDSPHNCATFEFIQSGTLENVAGADGESAGEAVSFRVHTTMFVRFDEDGRIAAMRTVHR